MWRPLFLNRRCTSNFSSKQLLWAHSLEYLLLISKNELEGLTDKYVEEDSLNSTEVFKEASLDLYLDKWLAVWQCWLANKSRLAVYRIMLGESHKMEEASFVLFKQLEMLLTDHLMVSLSGFKITDKQFFLLMAVSKEALLMPLLYGCNTFSNIEYGSLPKATLEVKKLLKTVLD